MRSHKSWFSPKSPALTSDVISWVLGRSGQHQGEGCRSSFCSTAQFRNPFQCWYPHGPWHVSSHLHCKEDAPCSAQLPGVPRLSLPRCGCSQQPAVHERRGAVPCGNPRDCASPKEGFLFCDLLCSTQFELKKKLHLSSFSGYKNNKCSMKIYDRHVLEMD